MFVYWVQPGHPVAQTFRSAGGGRAGLLRRSSHGYEGWKALRYAGPAESAGETLD